MNSRWRPEIAVLICMAIALSSLAMLASRSLADDCPGAFVRSSIAGEGSRVKLGLEGQTIGCGSSSIKKVSHEPQPYFTYEVSCSTDRRAAAEGLCSTTPVRGLGGSLRFELIIVPMGVASRLGSPV